MARPSDRLHDRARIHAQGGRGGDGATSFRREAHVPRGGPDGGDGGRGGDVVVVCDDSLRDLVRFSRRRKHHAGRGGHGGGALRHGATGETLVLPVPPGTRIVGEDGDLRGRSWELLAPGQRARVARGGAGGRGNKHFATATRQAPRFAERGLPGEEGWLALELKLLADAGLVGLPNAGKSSLLARLTRARPKVADYPFTTLSPVLGVLEGDERQLVVADIPGLIEGASGGAGLGHDFLAHLERTRVLVHVLDIGSATAAGIEAHPAADYETIEHELEAHDPRLAQLPCVLALSKVDLIGEERARAAITEWERRLGGRVPVVATSSATGAGLEALSRLLLQRVAESEAAEQHERADREAHPVVGAPAGGAADAGLAGAPSALVPESLAEHIVFRPAGDRGYRVERLGPRSFAVHGRGIELLLERFDIDNEEALAYLEARLRRIGVLKALEAEGFRRGDEVEIAGTTLRLKLQP
ncbi:MAG: GTPase ObgE [Actinobacteria bacterium]|nr:MAG: GTPase ObgE [Actinomycetota bacterium]